MQSGSSSFSVPPALMEGDHSTDLVFIVEGQRLHFSKMLLTLSSPVFQALLTPDYVQQHSGGIPMEGKKYNAVAFFFMQLHPVFCAVTPITDEMLLETLALAEEYKVDHISAKCEDYMVSRLELCEAKQVLTADTLLHYLTACEKYRLTKNRNRLVKLTAQQSTKSLQNSRFFELVPATGLKDVFLLRSQSLENDLLSVKNAINNKLPRVISHLKNAPQPTDQWSRGDRLSSIETLEYFDEVIVVHTF